MEPAVKRSSSTGTWILAALVVVAAVIAGLFALRHRSAPPAARVPAATTAPATATTTPPPARHPIEAARTGPAAASTAPLPALDQSDEAVAAALSRIGGDGVHQMLVAQALIPRIVATVNALPDRQVAPHLLPVHPPQGGFRVERGDGGLHAADNSARYARYMQALEHADTQTLVDWYVRHYPLFEQAYRELGYPDGHFNDRLVTVIDQLLATPEPAQPPALEPYKSYYRFTDPRLEALSAGQKILVRSGLQDERRIKQKLRAFREAVTGRTLPATPASASPAAAETSAG